MTRDQQLVLKALGTLVGFKIAFVGSVIYARKCTRKIDAQYGPKEA